MDVDSSLKKVVYFVDDNKQTCSKVEKLLARKGYEVKSFLSGEDCLKSLSKKKCDLLISELVMPGLDGIEFIKKVRKIRPKLPSVMVSAYGSVPTVVSSVKAGASHFIKKPWDNNNFLDIVEKVLEQNSHDAIYGKINKPISPAEKRVLKLLLKSNSNRSIAEQLNLSVRTVEDHRSSIMLKLGVDNVVDLVKITAKMDIDDND